MKTALLFLLLPFACFGQNTAKFPTAVTTEADLGIAVNRAETSLSVGINASATSLPVLSCAQFKAGMYVTIDNEFLAVCDCSANTLTVGVSSCPNVDGRGLDTANGSGPAASHLAGAKVQARISAWHHNQLAAEVQAIEGALGANLVNIPSQLPGGGTGTQVLRVKPNMASKTLEYAQASPVLVASDYSFPAQTPGGSLAPGANSIALAPCPLGVNGTDADHYLYVSGGVGTAEAVVITGGTCTSGAASGTVIVTAANNHSGAWTIRTATGGIQEAAVALGATGGTVQIAAGTTAVYAAITAGGPVAFRGVGPSTVLTPQSDGLSVFSVSALASIHGVQVRDLAIDGSAFAGLNTVTGINYVSSYRLVVDNVTFLNTAYAVYCDKCSEPSITNIRLIDNSRIWLGSTTSGASAYTYSPVVSNVTHYPTAALDAGLGYILTLQRAVNPIVTRFFTRDLQNAASGIQLSNDTEGATIADSTIVTPINGITISKTTVDGTSASPAWTDIHGLMLDRWTGIGVSADDGCYYTKVQGTFAGNGAQTAAVYLRASSAGSIVSNSVFQNIPSGYGVLVEAANVNFTIANNFFSMNNPAVGINVQAGASNGYVIGPNVFTGTATQIVDNGSGTSKTVAGNTGINNGFGQQVNALAGVYVNGGSSAAGTITQAANWGMILRGQSGVNGDTALFDSAGNPVVYVKGGHATLAGHAQQSAANGDLAGTVTLVAGAGTKTFGTAFTAAPVCTCTDQTAAAAVKCSTNTTTLTIAGTGADVIAYACYGNPN